MCPLCVNHCGGTVWYQPRQSALIRVRNSVSSVSLREHKSCRLMLRSSRIVRISLSLSWVMIVRGLCDWVWNGWWYYQNWISSCSVLLSSAARLSRIASKSLPVLARFRRAIARSRFIIKSENCVMVCDASLGSISDHVSLSPGRLSITLADRFQAGYCDFLSCCFEFINQAHQLLNIRAEAVGDSHLWMCDAYIYRTLPR